MLLIGVLLLGVGGMSLYKRLSMNQLLSSNYNSSVALPQVACFSISMKSDHFFVAGKNPLYTQL